jgi:hypothetical protein
LLEYWGYGELFTMVKKQSDDLPFKGLQTMVPEFVFVFQVGF